MDSILVDHLEGLLSGSLEGTRAMRKMVLLAACLAEPAIPPEIEKQLERLCRRIWLEEVFEALLAPLNACLRTPKDREQAAIDLSGLMAQIDESRKALESCEPVNQAVLIHWILEQAREKRLLGKLRSKR